MYITFLKSDLYTHVWAYISSSHLRFENDTDFKMFRQQADSPGFNPVSDTTTIITGGMLLV